MTETERKALALVNEVFRERDLSLDSYLNRTSNSYHEALCRAIEQHEAFRQEVSDAMKLLSEEHEAFRQEVSDAVGWWNMEYLLGDDLRKDMARFIIAKPDPLVEVMEELVNYSLTIDAASIRAALAKRGLKIVEVE